MINCAELNLSPYRVHCQFCCSWSNINKCQKGNIKIVLKTKFQKFLYGQICRRTEYFFLFYTNITRKGNYQRIFFLLRRSYNCVSVHRWLEKARCVENVPTVLFRLIITRAVLASCAGFQHYKTSRSWSTANDVTLSPLKNTCCWGRAVPF